MSSRILVTAPQTEVREDIRESILASWESLRNSDLEEAPEDQPLVFEAPTLDDALQYLSADGPLFDLIVTTLQIPESRSSQQDDAEEHGLELAKKCSHSEKILANVIVDTRFGGSQMDLPELLAQISGLRRVDLLISEQSPEDTITNVLRLRRSAGIKGSDTTVRTAGPDIVVDIDLTGEVSGYVILVNGTVHKKDDLMVSQKKLKRLIRRSDKLREESDDWVATMRDIGEDLYDVLISQNPSFLQQLLMVADGRPDTVHYRFRLDWKRYKIFFEAMVPRNEESEDDPRDFWMLKTPLSRRLALGRCVSASFTDEPFVLTLPQEEREPLNCLIIESDVHSDEPFEPTFYDSPRKPLPDKFPHMPRLRNVHLESTWLNLELGKLARTRADSKKSSPFHRVEIINPDRARKLDKNAAGFCQVLKEQFGDVHWHVVHFAGHSWYEDTYIHQDSERRGRGWLLFPPLRTGQRIEAVTAEQFAAFWRHRPEFVYLSSCHSSRDDVVFELARSEIKAIVGFRWNVDDDQAFEYAKAFYSGLLIDGERLERAFLKARKEVFEESRTNPIWAAATLVLEA